MSSNDNATIKKLKLRIKELEEQLVEATELYYEEGFDAGFALGHDEGFEQGKLKGWEEYNNDVELALFVPEGEGH